MQISHARTHVIIKERYFFPKKRIKKRIGRYAIIRVFLQTRHWLLGIQMQYAALA